MKKKPPVSGMGPIKYTPSALDFKNSSDGVTEFFGQEKALARIEIAIEAAVKRNEPVPHILLQGPEGVGKRTLALYLAQKIALRFYVGVAQATADAISQPGDVAGLLTNINRRDVVIIENIERLPRAAAKTFIHALTYRRLEVAIDQGPNARVVTLSLPEFSCIATTTEDSLAHDLLAGFRLVAALDRYSSGDLTTMINGYSSGKKLTLDAGAVDYIAQSSDGLPREAFRLIELVRDYAQVKHPATVCITSAIATEAVEFMREKPSPTAQAYDRVPIPAEVRREVWRRDGGKCVKCGSRERLEFDHIIPVSRGGSSTARNIELLCEACNRAKSDNIG
ncbi:MAG TPA: HNH endonuclease [Opitutaceae bacterium]|nr:HNH endonuclease [Opitutaceae bacterium]